MGVDGTLGRANVAIRATLDKLDGDLSQARGKVDSAVKRIASGAVQNLQTIGTGAMIGIGAATTAVAGLGAALAKVTIDAAPVEGISDAFDGLAESAGIGGDAMLQALQQGSAGMISQRDLMLSFNKAASLVSTDFAVQLPEAMQYLSKVSASTGQDMGFLMDSLVTGVGRLSPMILDNLSIQVSQAEATERAAEMFGVEAAALDKTQQQAGMMNVVLEKLAANTAAMPDVTESANAKLAQMRARFQDVKDQIGTAFLPALSSVMEIVSDLADRVLPPLVDVLENTVAPAVATVVGAFQDFLWMLDVGIAPMSALKIALGQIFGPEVADKIMNVVAQIRTFVDEVWTAIEPVVSWVTENVKLQDVLIALGIAVSTVVLPALWGIIAAAAPIVATFMGIVAVVALLRTAWESDFLGIRTALTDFWQNTAQPALSQLATWLSVNVPVAVEALRAFWVDTAWPAIQTAIQTVWPIIENIFLSISTWVTGTLIPTLQGLHDKWVNEVWPTIQTVTANVWTVIEGIFQEIGRWINDNLGPWVEYLREVWADTVWPAIQTALETAWGVIEPIFTSIKEWLGDTLPPIVEGIQSTFESAMSAIDSAIQPVKTAIDNLKSAAEGFWNLISSRTFKFNIKIPDLPEWATPDSPLPIHTAWANFADEMKRIEIAPRFDVEGNLGDVAVNRDRPSGDRPIVIYGLTLEGVQDKRGLLAELQGLT